MLRLPSRSLWAGLSLLLLTSSPPAALAIDASLVEEIELSNGMQVLLWPDPGIPAATVYTFWKVGSRNEAPGITGLAHFFEHMMFNGSENYPSGEFDRTMEDFGGRNNAYTTRDLTVYTDWVPSNSLEATLDLEADRIGRLSVEPAVVESERGVVASERRRGVDDNNFSSVLELLNATAWTAHPYQWPVIGWMSDIENWRQEDVVEFFTNWYTPSNAVMVICGAFERDELVGILEAKIGVLPSRTTPRDVVTREEPQQGERRATLRRVASSTMLAAGWHVPAASDPDRPALELASVLLSEGDGSRLHRRLVDQDQLALWVSSWSRESFDPGIFVLAAAARAGIEGPAIEAAIYEELHQLALEGPGEREMQKARNQLLTEFYREMASLDGRADALGRHELYQGDWRKLFGADERYLNVQAADIQRVVGKYLQEDNRNVVTLIPRDTEASDNE